MNTSTPVRLRRSTLRQVPLMPTRICSPFILRLDDRRRGMERITKMRFGSLALIGIAALAVSASSTSARSGCGPGYSWDGYNCTYDPDRTIAPPSGTVIGPGYRGPVYQGGPADGYRPGYSGYRATRRGDYGPQTNRGQDCYNVGGRRICCPKNWTVQGGQCAPYRGR